MIEYPSIINSSKAPREDCVAFDKLDGSNFRAKWTRKNGFTTFGSRTQLMDESHPHLGEAVTIFKRDYNDRLEHMLYSDKEFRHEREIIVYGEFFGAKSFAGIHVADDPKQLVFFDVLVGNKNRRFLPPADFIEKMIDFPTPSVIYVGKLNDSFIQEIRENKLLTEGVICKGTRTNGAYRGKIWSCKIKTQRYLDSLKDRFKDDWQKYAE